MSARTLAGILGISPATMSRIDNALGPVPGRKVIDAWLAQVGADASVRERVLALAEAAWAGATRWSDLFADRTHLQDQARERESRSVLVRNFQPTVIAGLLQTPAYMRALFPIADRSGRLNTAAATQARLDRQQILHEPGRRFEFLMAEDVLRWAPAEGLMTAQRDRLTQLATLSTVAIGVLPRTNRAATPWHNFIVHTAADGREYVTVELIHGAEQLHDEAGVRLYLALWDDLWAAAATGDDAVELIRGASR